METVLTEPPYASPHRLRVLPFWETEDPMSKRTHSTWQRREVRVSFEPSRTAASCLTHAYTRVVPIRRRVLRSCSRPTPAAETAARVDEGRR